MNGVGLRSAMVLALALIVPVALAYLGLARQLGAHPWWDVKIALIGAPLGTVAGGLAAIWLRRTIRLVLAFVVVGLAILAAVYGKTQFAASFAEDALAGKLWYFGWIGIAAGLSLFVAALFLPTRR